MLKEIYEQPEVLGRCIYDYFPDSTHDRIYDLLRGADFEEIHILACGTSFHAGLVGQFLLEHLAHIPTQVRSASEFLAAPLPLTRKTLMIVVSQSGETADVLAAIESAKRQPSHFNSAALRFLAITNHSNSSIARQATYEIPVLAGVENSVAATKTFAGQMALFYCLAFSLARQRHLIDDRQLEIWRDRFNTLPSHIEQVLQQEDTIAAIAATLKDTRHLMLLGTGIQYPIALEGALKLKETTYTHAEGYAAGEFLHGPIALLDSTIPVVALMPTIPDGNSPENSTESRIRTIVQKVRNNGSPVITIGAAPPESSPLDSIALPTINELLSPFLTIIPLQILAYHLAIARGIEVDRPRNITKSLSSS
jgi:glucosamine--fructose-6-phosphate aminotransferase (isomerizing)